MGVSECVCACVRVCVCACVSVCVCVRENNHFAECSGAIRFHVESTTSVASLKTHLLSNI